MTAATYTFTLSAAQSSAASMVVAMRAKTGSSIPGTAARWQGGAMPQATLNFAAGATTATTTVNTAPNATVDVNAEYEWYKVSSNPSDLTLDTSSLPTVTITDDDSSGGGTSYGPTTTQDTGVQNTGSTSHVASFDFVPGRLRAIWYLGLDSAGQNAACAVEQVSGTDGIVRIGSYSGGVFTPNENQGRSIDGSANATFAMRLNANGSVDALRNGAIAATWPSSLVTGPTGGTRARIVSTTANATLLNARIAPVT